MGKLLWFLHDYIKDLSQTFVLDKSTMWEYNLHHSSTLSVVTC